MIDIKYHKGKISVCRITKRYSIIEQNFVGSLFNAVINLFSNKNISLLPVTPENVTGNLPTHVTIFPFTFDLMPMHGVLLSRIKPSP